MTVLELNDRLLDQALRVGSEQVPAELRAKIRQAVAAAGGQSPARLAAWSDLTVAGRPALRTALWFALLTGALVILLIGTLAYLGSPPPSVTSAPIPVTPSPTGPAGTATLSPSVAPTTSSRPGPTNTPWPMITAGPEVAPTAYKDFVAHVDDSIAAFSVAAPAWYTFVRTFDGAAAAQSFSEVWLPQEHDWIGAHRPESCYARSYAAWNNLVSGILDATRHVGTGNGLEMNPDFPPMWADRSAALIAFEPSTSFSCTPISQAEFAEHVRTSLSNFGAAADGLYYWVKFLDYGGLGPDYLRQRWLPDERTWLNVNAADACISERWQAWRDAIEEMSAAARWMEPFGGTSDDEFARFAAAREAIANFDPEAGLAC